MKYYWSDILNVKQLERIASDLRQRVKYNESAIAIIGRFWDTFNKFDRTNFSKRYNKYVKVRDEYITELNKLNYHIQLLKINQ